jgi:hypothetical protein
MTLVLYGFKSENQVVPDERSAPASAAALSTGTGHAASRGCGARRDKELGLTQVPFSASAARWARWRAMARACPVLHQRETINLLLRMERHYQRSDGSFAAGFDILGRCLSQLGARRRWPKCSRPLPSSGTKARWFRDDQTDLTHYRQLAKADVHQFLTSPSDVAR